MTIDICVDGMMMMFSLSSCVDGIQVHVKENPKITLLGHVFYHQLTYSRHAADKIAACEILGHCKTPRSTRIHKQRYIGSSNQRWRLPLY